MKIKEAAVLFLEKHKTFKQDSLDIGKDPIENAIELLEENAETDYDLIDANVYFEIVGFDSISGNPEIIEWYQTEWQVSYYDLPKSERTDQRDWTIRESFDNNFDEVISYIKQLHLVEERSDITLTRWEDGNPVAEEDWKFYLN